MSPTLRHHRVLRQDCAIHRRTMKRLRNLAAFLGCLAVLAGGFMTVAAAAVSARSQVLQQSAIGAEPCTHCEDCGVPCPAPTASCMQVCVGVAPSLGVTAFPMPAIDGNQAPPSLRAAILSGLSPPPDPFPPRN